MAQIITSHVLPARWQLNANGRPFNQFQHIHLGHVPVTAPGNYRVHAAMRPQLIRQSQPAASVPGGVPYYYSIIAALFLSDPADQGGSGPTTVMVPGSERNIGTSLQLQWEVPPATLFWPVNVIQEDLGPEGGPGKQWDIRCMLFVPPGYPNPNAAQGDWIGVSGEDAVGATGRTWMYVEGPLA